MKIYWLSLISLTDAQRKFLYDLHGEGVDIKHRKEEKNFDKHALASEILKRPDGIVYTDAEGQVLAKAVGAGCRFRVFGYKRLEGGRHIAVAYEIAPKSVQEVVAEPLAIKIPTSSATSGGRE